MMDFLKRHWVIIGIMAIAAFFRFWEIGSYPAGLFPDEAANGLDINSIFEGDRQPFYERGNGREALFFYAIALVVSIFGRGVWQHHVVSAGFGFVEVFTTYLLTSRLFGKRVAWVTSFLMAVSSYAVTMTRTAFRANTIPFFTTLTLYFLVKYFQETERKAKLWAAFWAGAMFGLGFYTYISYRMMIPLLFGFGLLIAAAYFPSVGRRMIVSSVLGVVVLAASILLPIPGFVMILGLVAAVAILFWPFKSEILGKWREFMTYVKYPALTFGSGFVLAFGWLGYYFWTHPGSFVGRAGQVSVFNEDLQNEGGLIGTLIEVFQLTMKSFFVNGDLNWRHNVSGEPFLSPFVSPFFAVGLIIFTWAFIVMLKQVWQQRLDFKTSGMAVIAILFWFMLAPEVTTAEGIPHGLRLIGVIPAIFIISAYAIVMIWDKLSQYAHLRFTKIAIPTIFFTGIFIYNFYLYFGVATASPDYYYAFRSDLTEVSRYLNERQSKEDTYLSLDTFSVQTVDYLTTETGRPFYLLDPQYTYQVQLASGDHVVFTMSTLFDITRFIEAHPDAELVHEAHNEFGQTIMRVYRKP